MDIYKRSTKNADISLSLKDGRCGKERVIFRWPKYVFSGGLAPLAAQRVDGTGMEQQGGPPLGAGDGLALTTCLQSALWRTWRHAAPVRRTLYGTPPDRDFKDFSVGIRGAPTTNVRYIRYFLIRSRRQPAFLGISSPENLIGLHTYARVRV